jgi:hypothetical protein
MTTLDAMMAEVVGRDVVCVNPRDSGKVLRWEPLNPRRVLDVLIERPNKSQAWCRSQDLRQLDGKSLLPSRAAALQAAKLQKKA